MTSLEIFKPPMDEEEAGAILATHMPLGRVWGNKNTAGSNQNGLIRGMASVFKAVQEKIYELAQEFNVNDTVDLLEDWEKSVGIPDDCIFQFTDLDERRQRIIQRLRKQPIVTLSELQEYIDAFFPDDTIILQNGLATTPFEYDFEVNFLGDINDRFVIIANIETGTIISSTEFEYQFEYEFTGGPDTFLLECLLRNVLPGNVAILIKFVGV